MALENVMGAWRARASQFSFLIMFFSFPIFSVPCGKGACSSPAEVVATFGYERGFLVEDIAKVLVYPGAMLSTVEGIVSDNARMEWPAWETVLSKFNLSEPHSDAQPPVSLGFVVGCILCLIGGFFSMFGPSVFSLVGMLIICFYIYTAGAENKDISAMPMFALAVICSFAWLTFDTLSSFFVSQKPTGISKKQL